MPVAENEPVHPRLSPSLPPHPVTGPGLVRFPRPEAAVTSTPFRPAFIPRTPLNPGVGASIQPVGASKVKQTGVILQNMMLRHPRPPGTRPPLVQSPAVFQPPSPVLTTPLRQQPRQRSAGEVTPLRKPLPPEGPLPLKPKRPPSVNLEPFMRFNRGHALNSPRNTTRESLCLILTQILNYIDYYSEYIHHKLL